MGLQERSQEELKEVRKTISRFCSTVSYKWKSSHRMLDWFLLHNSEWLDKKLFVPVSHVPHTAKGRQEKTFSESSERSKRRGKEGLCKTTSILRNCLLLLRWASEEVEIHWLHKKNKKIVWDSTNSGYWSCSCSGREN